MLQFETPVILMFGNEGLSLAFLSPDPPLFVGL